MILDKFELFDSDNVEVKAENTTLLKFEISETAPIDTASATDIYDSANTDVKLEFVDASEEEKQELKEEFAIPETFVVDSKYNSPSFVDAPGSPIPAYVPRFTSVSENYRMQDDPRPRYKGDVPVVRVEREDSLAAPVSEELDPTTETVEDTDIEKVVVTSTAIRNSDAVDETLTVLKFATEPGSEAEEDTMSQEEREELEQIAEIESLKDPVDTEDAEKTEPKKDSDTDEATEPEVTDELAEASDTSSFEFVPPITCDNDEPLGSSEDARASNMSSEFNSPAQRDSVKDKFLDTLMSIRVRFAGALLLMLVMVAVDCLAYFGINALSVVGLGHVSYARAVVDMQFSICIFLFAIPEIVGALGLLAKGKFAPELINVFSLGVVIFNDLAIVAGHAQNYLTFGVLYGLECLVTIIAAYYKTASAFASFKLVSRNAAKNVIDKRLTRELTRENLALDGIVDEYTSKIARMFRTVFVSGFFKRSSKSCENSSNTFAMIGIGAGIAFVAGVVTFFIDGYSIVSGAQSLALVFMLSYPVFSILTHKLPFKHLCNRAALEESAFVGESSVLECADVDVFAYDDTEIFGVDDVSIQKVHLYGKAYNTPKAMKHMYALFSVVGGPLDFVFSTALDRKCSPAEDVVIEDDGISGMMEGHRICAGTEEYMRKHGIVIPEDDYKTNTSSFGSTRIMYGAENGEVYVKFFIRYSFSEEFTMLLPDLREKNIVPLIYTRDPNVTTDLLKVLTLGEDVIRVMNKYVPRSEEEKTYKCIDSGMVTHGNKDNAINMILLAKKYAAFQSTITATEFISMIVGAVLAVVLAIGDMFVIPATLLSLWQIVWCAVLCVRSRLTFSARPKLDEEAEAQ